MRLPLFIATILAVVSASFADETPQKLFDPARHMRVAEVRPGMKGYGLTVFKGTAIEKFDVEVLAVVHNAFSPQNDAILVRCGGKDLEHTGAIAGMSGSPVFLRDDSGRERLAGAFAFGWPLTKDPIGGVQPIEYMLDVPAKTRQVKPTTASVAGEARAGIIIGKPKWFASQSGLLPGTKVREIFCASAKPPFGSEPQGRRQAAGGELHLAALATPLMSCGIPRKVLDEFAPAFRAYGLELLEGGGGSASATDQKTPAKLEPGSVLAVPLLTGDIDMTAVGTCTEVIGQNVFGFGHPFNDEGPVSLPLGGGEISMIVPNLQTSFKLGFMTKAWGTLYSDESVGVAGKIGDEPHTVPITIAVKYTDGSGERTYHFKSASHPKLTPLISIAALAAAVTGVHELPPYHTLDYDVSLTFANGKMVRCVDRAVNSGAAELFTALGAPMVAAADNPFEQVQLAKVEGTVNVTPEAREAMILSANVPRLILRPGETVKAYVTYRPFRAGEAVIPVEFELPKDLSDGTYQLVMCDWQQYLVDEQASKPFRFAAESAQQVFDVIDEIAAVRHDQIYLRLVREADGVAIGRTAMRSLPSSHRQVLIGAGRSNVTPFVSSLVKRIAMPYVMSGSAQVDLTVDKDARLEPAAGKPKHELPTTPRPEQPARPPIIKEPAPPGVNPPG